MPVNNYMYLYLILPVLILLRRLRLDLLDSLFRRFSNHCVCGYLMCPRVLYSFFI